MIEQLQYVAKEYGEKRAKEAMKKFTLNTISKFYKKIEPLYQGILHENILETRLVFPSRLCSEVFQHILDTVGLSQAEVLRTF